ncbi:MAG TPA: hypothetical protein VN698_12540, partial [Bacteroidia bacterium]|nr:hypothetical protein [Bacteroidia bacterium]
MKIDFNSLNFEQAYNDLLKENLRVSLSAFIQHFFPVIDNEIYVHNWHIDLLCDYLQIVARRFVDKKTAASFEYTILTPAEVEYLFNNMNNLIINIPPGFMKSLTVNVMFQSWLWFLNAKISIINASYANALALRDSVKMRTLLTSKEFIQIAPNFGFAKDQNAKGYYVNNARGFRYSTSFGAGSTGHRANLLCIDDPITATDVLSTPIRDAHIEYYNQQLSNRLNDMDRSFKIIIMQRLHDYDLCGYLLRKDEGQSEKEWTHLCLRAKFDDSKPRSIGDNRKHGELLFPARFGERVLQLELNNKGNWGYAGQYQQDPVPKEGGLIKREYFNNSLVPLPCLMSDFYNVGQFWDMAFKKNKTSDCVASAIMTYYNNKFYILDIVKKRASFSESLQMVKNTAELHPQTRHNIHIEDKANGTAIIEQLRGDLSTYSVSEIEAKDSKFARVQSTEPIWCAGNIYIWDKLKDEYIFDDYSQKEWSKYDLIVNDMCAFREG